MQLDIDQVCRSLTALGDSAQGGDPEAESDNTTGTPARTGILSQIEPKDGNQCQPGVQ